MVATIGKQQPRIQHSHVVQHHRQLPSLLIPNSQTLMFPTVQPRPYAQSTALVQLPINSSCNSNWTGTPPSYVPPPTAAHAAPGYSLAFPPQPYTWANEQQQPYPFNWQHSSPTQAVMMVRECVSFDCNRFCVSALFQRDYIKTGQESTTADCLGM